MQARPTSRPGFRKVLAKILDLRPLGHGVASRRPDARFRNVPRRRVAAPARTITISLAARAPPNREVCPNTAQTWLMYGVRWVGLHHFPRPATAGGTADDRVLVSTTFEQFGGIPSAGREVAALS